MGGHAAIHSALRRRATHSHQPANQHHLLIDHVCRLLAVGLIKGLLAGREGHQAYALIHAVHRDLQLCITGGVQRSKVTNDEKGQQHLDVSAQTFETQARTMKPAHMCTAT